MKYFQARKFTAALAALALAFAAFTPSVADARGRHGGHYYNGGGHYYGGGHRGHYRHGDHGDAVAAGVVGLVLGLAVGAAASQPPAPRCYNGCYAPPPPPPSCGNCYAPGYYRQGYAPQPYYQQGYRQAPQQPYDDRAYDPRYDDSGLEGGGYDQRSGCVRSERQWDRYAQRYVTVDIPC